ncbi:type I phosphomannose isomerase catalytic subunit [Christiangramia portivictoriae]|uniref:type I phosphomannose isomerase catalytic subunit n=1 Tax=Christiangramia portivictoriae TaxID=326069 RepID=UPI000405ED48|nr:type I phosphomannose isomerase catalytic subunit [Christiangramia portivictoriae]
MINYPIKFEPILHRKIWGGNKLASVLKKKTISGNIGESWEISAVPGNISVVSNGSAKGKNLMELISIYKNEILGSANYKQFGNKFPLLIKFIDAKNDLSVQLHPGDDLAKKRHNSFGKTEMWYVLQSDKGAKLNIGFKNSINREQYINALNSGKIVSLLNFEEVKAGDAIFINPGKVHAIGAGVLLAEIQQTSDVTYRIYDWNRKDSEGKSRELHTELALDAIDFQRKNDFRLSYNKLTNEASKVIECKYFKTNHLLVGGNISRNHSDIDSFIIYICTEGSGVISTTEKSLQIEKGETVLIPAINKKVSIHSNSCELLEVYI